MTDTNEKTNQSQELNNDSSRNTSFGYGHGEITDDFNALLSVLGFDNFSTKLKQKALKIVRR